MTEPVLAYFVIMAANVAVASFTVVTYMGALWPTIAYGVIGWAAVSVTVSGVLFALLFYFCRKAQDTTSIEENEAQMAYLTEWNRLHPAKVKAPKKTC